MDSEIVQFHKAIEDLEKLDEQLSKLKIEKNKEVSEEVELEIETFNALRIEAVGLANSLSVVLHSLSVSLDYINEKYLFQTDDFLDIEEVNGFLLKETKNGEERKGWKWYLENPDKECCSYSHYEILNNWMGRNNICFVDLLHAGFYVTYYFQIDSPVGKSMIAVESPEGKFYKIKGRW